MRERVINLMHIPFSVKYFRPAWATFYLATAAFFFRESSVRGLAPLLNEKRGIPEFALPVIYALFGVLFIVAYFRRWPVNYWTATLFWSVPLWLHFIAAVDVGIPNPSRVRIIWAIICLAWMADMVEDIETRER